MKIHKLILNKTEKTKSVFALFSFRLACYRFLGEKSKILKRFPPYVIAFYYRNPIASNISIAWFDSYENA